MGSRLSIYMTRGNPWVLCVSITEGSESEWLRHLLPTDSHYFLGSTTIYTKNTLVILLIPFLTLPPVFDMSLTRMVKPKFSVVFSSLKSRWVEAVEFSSGKRWVKGRSIAPDLQSRKVFFSFSLTAVFLPSPSHGVNKGSFSFLPTNHFWHELGNLVSENQPAIF